MAACAVRSNELSRESLRWDLLEVEPPSGERLTARLAVPSRSPDVFIGVDYAANRYILVRIPRSEVGQYAERTSRGIAVQTVELHAGSADRDRFVEIACLDPQGHIALDALLFDLMTALEAGSNLGRIRLVQGVIAKWRRFWSDVPKSLLSKDEQLGLFGELLFLRRWLIPSLGVGRAIGAWRGPSGSRNDFEFPGLGIEVKTTGRLDGAHTIHGLEQLLRPEAGKLFLYSLSVREELTATESLPNEVREVRALVGAEHQLRSDFDRMLYASGYDDRLESEYASAVFRIRGQGLYDVRDGFPRLTGASIIGGVPTGVSNIQYELRLDAAGDCLLANSPDMAAIHLKPIQ